VDGMIALDNLQYVNLGFLKSFFHFDIMSQNVYIASFRKYNMAGEKKKIYDRI
jgi:hypothetical protein